MHKNIPFNKQAILGGERRYISQAIDDAQWSGGGAFCHKVEEFVQSHFGTPRAIATASCTTALNVSGLLCRLEPGDEVIMPSFTFTSTANAVLLRGAKPVFVDIRPDTQNIDETLIEEAITERTKAICVVHYAGVACEMDEIMEIARRHNLVVIEDAAQGVFAKYKNSWLGSIGDLGCYSFHATKNFTCGEGGVLLINNRDYISRAEIICDKGTNRSEFFRGEARKYEWRDVGLSAPPSELSAAALLAQLEMGMRVNQKRERLFSLYQSLLKPLETAGDCRLPVIPDHCVSNHHIFYLVTASSAERISLIGHLKSRGVTAYFHYIPLHMSDFGKTFHTTGRSLANTEIAGNRLLRLPMFYDLDESDVAYIAEAILDFYGLSLSESPAASEAFAASP